MRKHFPFIVRALSVALICFTNVSAGMAVTESVDGAIPVNWVTKPTPSSLGWKLVADNSVVSDWPNARFETSTANTQMYNADGSAYSGSLFFIRWDANAVKNVYYVYPMQLEANATYRLSLDCGYWDNYNSQNGGVISDKALLLSVSQQQTLTSFFSSKMVYCGDAHVFSEASFVFSSRDAGTYYLAITGGWGMYAIARMQLQRMGSAAEINVNNGGRMTVDGYKDATVTVSGATDLHLSGDSPLVNSSVNLTSDSAWLFFDEVRPSAVSASLLSGIRVGGQPVADGKNVRLAAFGSGTVVIPDGPQRAHTALTVYDEENRSGASLCLGADSLHTNLGPWNNRIKSFCLKRGFMATLANNPDGTGFSHVFIADDADLLVNVLPEGMENFVSYIRVAKWTWPSKKGWAGNVDNNVQNATWFYNWNVDGNASNPYCEYVTIRQNLWWPSFASIVAKDNVNYLLGLNEPDQADQANCTSDQIVALWPDMLRTGFRLGSPCSADPSSKPFTKTFFSTIDSLNYRVDFVAGHLYKESRDAAGWVSMIKGISAQSGGRPVWITEWNNGANWTSESWPDAKGNKCDANCNVVYDANGAAKTVNRPLTAANAEKQRSFISNVLPAFDQVSVLERYSIYNWVEDARAMILDGKLTPAGKVYAAHKAALAYRPANAYNTVWKIAPPFPYISVSARRVHLSWYDHNGETGISYIVERKQDNESDFKEVGRLYPGSDYSYGGTAVFEEPVACANHITYRIKAISYKNTESIYSREKTITASQIEKTGVDAVPADTSKEPADNGIYSVTGVRLRHVPESGFYIQNGEKHIKPMR